MISSWVSHYALVALIALLGVLYLAQLYNVAPFVRRRTPWAGYLPEIWAVTTLAVIVPAFVIGLTSSSAECVNATFGRALAWALSFTSIGSECHLTLSPLARILLLSVGILAGQVMLHALGDLHPKIVNGRKTCEDLDGGYRFQVPTGWQLVRLSLTPAEFGLQELRVALQPRGDVDIPLIGVTIVGKNETKEPFFVDRPQWTFVSQRQRLIGQDIPAIETRRKIGYGMATMRVSIIRSQCELLFHLTSRQGDEKAEHGFEEFLSSIKLR